MALHLLPKAALALLISVCCLPRAAAAQQTFTWNGSAGMWSSAASWVPNGTPGADDHVIIGAGTLNLDVTTSVAKMTMTGGSLDGNGILTVTDSTRWTGGTWNGRGFADSAAVYIPAGAVLTMTGTDTKYLRGRDILNDGSVHWEDGTVEVRWPTTIHNKVGGQFFATASNTISRSNGVLDFLNDGEFLRQGNSGQSTLAHAFGSFVNNGSVVVGEGSLRYAFGETTSIGGGGGSWVVESDATLRFDGGSFAFADTSTVSGGGTIRVGSGYVTLGSADVSTVLVSGTGTLEFTGTSVASEINSVTLSGGAFGGLATININSSTAWEGGSLGVRGRNGVINLIGDTMISGDDNKLFGAGTYNNRGTMTWTGGGDLEVRVGGLFVNEAGAVFDVQTDASFIRSNGTITIRNEGLITKTAGTGTSTWSLPFAPLDNAGVIRVDSGTLQLFMNSSGSNSADSGTYFVADSASLHFSSHMRTFASTVEFLGTGTYRFAGTTVANQGATFKPGASPGEFGTLSIAGPFDGPIAESTLEVEIGGANPGTEFDQLHTSDYAAPAGSLKVVLINNFSPADGDRFLIVAADSGATREFESLVLPDGMTAHLHASDIGVELVIGTNVATEDEVRQPDAFRLYAPYPNPARSTATVDFELPQPSTVRVATYDILGREVSVSLDGSMPAGRHSAIVEAAALAPGVYFVRIEAGDDTAAKQFVITN